MTTPALVLEIPPGYGFSTIPASKWRHVDPLTLLDRLLVWETPQRTERYVIGVDVSDGVGQDRSVIDVTRVGTVERGEEQVAQFVTDSVDSIALAGYVDAIGRLYRWVEDDMPALVAIECNGHGLATQAQLLQHFGYDHLFIWRHEDAISARGRLSRAYGWYTTRRSRPIILARYIKAVTTVDERTGMPDYRINSSHTVEELRDFQTEGPLWAAEAGPGSHDDCIMAGAIGIHVSQTLYLEEGEPLPDRRRRLQEEKARRTQLAESIGQPRVDYINTDCTVDEINEMFGGGEEDDAAYDHV